MVGTRFEVKEEKKNKASLSRRQSLSIAIEDCRKAISASLVVGPTQPAKSAVSSSIITSTTDLVVQLVARNLEQSEALPKEKDKKPINEQISTLYELEEHYSKLPTSNDSSRSASAATSKNNTMVLPKLKKMRSSDYSLKPPMSGVAKTLKKNESDSSSDGSIMLPTSGDSSKNASRNGTMRCKKEIAIISPLSPTALCNDIFQQVQEVHQCLPQKSEENTAKDAEKPLRRFTR